MSTGDPKMTKKSSLLVKSGIVKKIAVLTNSYSSSLVKIMMITNI